MHYDGKYTEQEDRLLIAIHQAAQIRRAIERMALTEPHFSTGYVCGLSGGKTGLTADDYLAIAYRAASADLKGTAAEIARRDLRAAEIEVRSLALALAESVLNQRGGEK